MCWLNSIIIVFTKCMDDSGRWDSVNFIYSERNWHLKYLFVPTESSKAI